MSNSLLILSLVAMLFLSIVSRRSGGELEEKDKGWCIADEQRTEEELQAAMDWACGKGGANCSEIQQNKTCYLPNTTLYHASFAFNSYFQSNKHNGASCYFKAAALFTQLDPSYNSCRYEYLP